MITTTEIGQAAVGALVIIGYIKTRLMGGRTDSRINEIHVLVNSKMSAALTRIEELEIALEKALKKEQAE